MTLRRKFFYLLYQLNKAHDLPFFDKLRVKIINQLLKSEVNNLFVRANVTIHEFNRLKLGNDVWIGANVTILGGVTIANGTIISAGAVVNKDVLIENTIIGGVPAKHIKHYNDR